MSRKSSFLLSLNDSGISLIQVLVALGIMAVVTTGFMTLLANQATEVQAIDEKMAMQGIQVHLRNVLSSTSFCSCFIGNNTFNYTTSAWNSFPSVVASSYDAACAPRGTPYLTVGSLMQPRLLPTALNLEDVTETTAGSGNFSANLTVQFDQALLKRSRKKLSVPMYFSVNMIDPAAARRLSTCFTVAPAAAIDLATLCGEIGGVYNAASTPPCQPTYQ